MKQWKDQISFWEFRGWENSCGIRAGKQIKVAGARPVKPTSSRACEMDPEVRDSEAAAGGDCLAGPNWPCRFGSSCSPAIVRHRCQITVPGFRSRLQKGSAVGRFLCEEYKMSKNPGASVGRDIFLFDFEDHRVDGHEDEV